MILEPWKQHYIDDVCKRMRFLPSEEYQRRSEIEGLLRKLMASAEMYRSQSREIPSARTEQIETIGILTGISLWDYIPKQIK